MGADADAIVVGGGPAGATAAALLAGAGWDVLLVESSRFPRDKVCGECLPPGALDWLDALGVGAAVRREAGPELESLSWLDGRRTVEAPLPAGLGRHRHGRALGRARLDALLLEHARARGAAVWQATHVTSITGVPGDYRCEWRLVPRAAAATGAGTRAASPPYGTAPLRAPVVIDARGSAAAARRGPGRDSDLLAFKVRLTGTRLAPGRLPLLAFPGGYGGLVVADGGRTTLALCLRRDRLRACRAAAPGRGAGAALEHWLRQRYPALAGLLEGASQDGPWQATGPLRPGIRVAAPRAPLRVGNAAGETHPLAGEGIAMAIQSAVLLCRGLAELGPRRFQGEPAARLRAAYARAWHQAFQRRLWAAGSCAHVAMRPGLARPAGALLAARPELLATAARFAGKHRPALRAPPPDLEETPP